MSQRDRTNQRGSAAVEFALVVPVLLILVLGIIEFGRVYYVQTVLSGAAREGVRSMALQNNTATAKTVTKNTATGIPLSDAHITVSTYTAAAPLTPLAPATCTVTGTTAANTAKVTVRYPMPYFTSFFGASTLTLTGQGVMLCNG